MLGCTESVAAPVPEVGKTVSHGWLLEVDQFRVPALVLEIDRD